MATTLGIHSGHDASAVLFKDDQMVAAVSQERLTRIKGDGCVPPELAVESVLDLGDRRRAAIDHLALLYTDFPDAYCRAENLIDGLRRSIKRWRRRVLRRPKPNINYRGLMHRVAKRQKTFDQYFDQRKFLDGEGYNGATLRFVDHHEAHAIGAAYYSGFDRCAVITVDGVGDWNIHHTSSVYRDGELTRCHVSDAFDASAGYFYSDITQLLGFKTLRHEGKVTGLAALGDPTPLYDVFSRALGLSPDGHRLESAFSNVDPHAAGHRELAGRRFNYLKQAIQGHSRENVAAAAQKVLEDVVTELVRRFLEETGERRVALNGGVFANVKLNQRIIELPEVESVFVFPAMSDAGNCVGAALLDIKARDPEQFRRSAHALEHVFWGPDYSVDQIKRELDARGLISAKLDEKELIDRAAEAIHNGLVVGWFQGRMEFGPRALGNRSMLARPTDAKINDWLNQRLERSEFMPFAPSVLAEHADTIFDNVAKARHTAEFMTITFDVKPEWRARIPAVVHVDGTARPQLVTTRSNPLYHRLISAYHRLSGIPLVLNTSFNVHEEPIVCAPPEAIQAYIEKRVDCLAIGPFWLGIGPKPLGRVGGSSEGRQAQRGDF